MTDSIATIEEQPNQTLGMIMEAANALSSIGDDVEQRREEHVSTQEPTSEKQSDYDSSVRNTDYDQEGETAPSTGVFAADSVKNEPAAQGGVDNTSGALALFGPSQPGSEQKPSGELQQPEGATGKDELFNFNDSEGQEKRYLPDNKKPDAAPTFPEKLMKMMKWAVSEGVTCVQWVDDGKSFVINHPDSFTRDVVPRFFKATKFSSFTRKLYRWGFRQVNRGIGPDDPIIFGNDYFQRDNEELMCKMKSTTAASARKMDVKPPYMDQPMSMTGIKHGLDLPTDEQTAKRLMLTNQLYQQKSDMMGMAAQNQSMYGLMSAHGQLSLTNALRPATIGGFQNNQQGLMQMQQQFNQNSMQMPMALNASDNVHQQLLQLHQMQLLGQDGLQGQDGMGSPMNDYQMQQQQQQQLALQMQPQQALSMQPQYSQLGMTSFQPTMQAQQVMGNPTNLYDYIPQNAYPNPGSTVEIVNAAISALRYAN